MFLAHCMIFDTVQFDSALCFGEFADITTCEFCRPTHDNLRPTLSPLLHSAIVHGVTPKARVKGAEKAPDAPYIKSVLGFHSVEPDASHTYWETGSSYSPSSTLILASIGFVHLVCDGAGNFLVGCRTHECRSSNTWHSCFAHEKTLKCTWRLFCGWPPAIVYAW